MPIPLVITRLNQRYLNRVTIKLAGHGSIIDLEHVGRRSGTVRHTPLMAFRQGGTVTIALTYGPDVQWLKNVRSAGGARIHMAGEILTLGAPEMLEATAGLARVSQPQRTLLRWPVRCRDFVSLPVLASRAART